MKDYREFLISKWATTGPENFPKPKQQDLENQSRFYEILIDKYFPAEKNVRLLEIGCGWGGMLFTLQKQGYTNIEAIDIIPQCCDFVTANLGIRATCVDAFQFFQTNSLKFDVIAAFDVLEHFRKDQIISLLVSIYASLNPGGLFIMRSPNGGSLNGLYTRYSGFTHEIAFTPISIDEVFKAVGFQHIQCVPDLEFKGFLESLITRFIMKVIGRLFSLDPRFVNSANIIATGRKAAV